MHKICVIKFNQNKLTSITSIKVKEHASNKKRHLIRLFIVKRIQLINNVLSSEAPKIGSVLMS